MFIYKLVENIRFTANLVVNNNLFTSATSFTLKRRALLSSLTTAEKLSRFWSHLFVNLHTGGFVCNFQLPITNYHFSQHTSCGTWSCPIRYTNMEWSRLVRYTSKRCKL